MNKRKARNFGGLVACLACTALVGCGLYLGNSTVRSFVTGSSSSAAATSVANADGTIGMALPNGPMFASAAGNTLGLTATLSPADVSDKRIAWTVSDPSKVALQSAQTSSGTANVANLIAVFSGSVTVTAKSVSNPSAAVSCNLYCYDGVMSTSSGSLWLSGVDYSDQDVLKESGTAGSYCCGQAHSDSSSYPYKFSVLNFECGPSATVGYSVLMAGEDHTRIPSMYSSYGVATAADKASASWVTAPNDFFDYGYSLSDVDKAVADKSVWTVSLRSFHLTVSGADWVFVEIRFVTSSYVDPTKADYSYVSFGGSKGCRINFRNAGSFVLPSGISGLGDSEFA